MKQTIGQKILHSSLTKIIIGIIVCVGLVALGQTGIEKLLDASGIAGDAKRIVSSLSVAVLSILSYSLLYKYYEKRKITELSVNRFGKNMGTGLMLGFVLQSLTILTIYLLGGYAIASVNPFSLVLVPLVMAISASVFEEILMRGILFRLMEEKLGSYLALGLSALIFGLLHMSNPNSSLIMGLAIAIQAGLLLGAAYIYTRNLWFPIGIHLAWNFTQSGIYGAATSGYASGKSLFTANIEGAGWLTGGDFGPEGSIQATLFCLVATIVLMVLSHKKKNIIPFRGIAYKSSSTEENTPATAMA